MNVDSKIRVLIADDSPTLARVLTAILSEDPRIEVIGHATDGAQAVAMAIALQPDVITMDMMMPELDGLAATARIMAEAPARVLVISSIADDREVDLGVRAVAAGALEVIPKMLPGESADLAAWGRRVTVSVRLMAEVPVVRRPRAVVAPDKLLRPPPGAVIGAIGIASSTGGPPVLATLLAGLGPGLPVPVFIAQHLASGFTGGLVRWLCEVSGVAVEVGRAGLMPRAGTAYLPPDSCHLEVDREGLLVTTPEPGVLCPSGDRLLSSLAIAYGSRACGVVLTGMGGDGATGLLAIRRATGLTIAQDEASCVVFGMPKVARDLDAASVILCPGDIVLLLRQRCQLASARRGAERAD